MEQLLRAIPGILKDLETNAGANEALVFGAWNQVAGNMLSSRTEAIEFHDRRLVIGVDDKTWQRNLEELSPQMLAKLNEMLGQGSVTFIEFRVDGRRSQI
jgi:hypothetical protein